MATLTEWVLDTIKDNWGGYGTFYGQSYGGPVWEDADIRRVNGDDGTVIDDGIRIRKGKPDKNNYVIASTDTINEAPLGVNNGYAREAIVHIRVEGLHADQHGHVADAEDADFLAEGAKLALRSQEDHPDAPGADYARLYVENETDGSSNFRDYYQREFDVRFVGHKP